MDLDKLTPRELVTGLMRGNADDMKLGYSAKSATDMAAHKFKLELEEVIELGAYADGFADGIREDTNRLYPA